MLSSVTEQSLTINSKSLFRWLLNSNRDPTMSPMIALSVIFLLVGIILGCGADVKGRVTFITYNGDGSKLCIEHYIQT